MTVSFFDTVIQSTNPVADAVFGKTFVLAWQNETIDPFMAILSAHLMGLDDDGHNVIETVHSHNFEITAADVVFGGSRILPQPGMQFLETLADGTTATYEIVKSAKGRCYDPLDSEETRLLVFALLL